MKFMAGDEPTAVSPDGGAGDIRGGGKRTRRAAFFGVALLVVVVAAFAVRAWNLENQIAGGDELHAVRGALHMPLQRALITYKPADNCIPLTSYFRLLLDLGLEPSEISFRLPSLLASLALMIGLPFWVRPRMGASAALTTAALVAISPILIHYSGLIRSYAIINFLCFLSIISFLKWLESDSHRAGALFAVSGAIAVWFHPVAGPMVVSPFLYFAVTKTLRRSWIVPGWRSACLLGTALVGWILVFIVPARKSLLELMSLKRSDVNVTLGSWKGVAGIFAGTADPGITTAFWCLAVLGGALWVRRRPREAGLILVALLGQVVGLLILSPYAMSQSTIFARYLLITLPWILVAVATSITFPALLKAKRPIGRIVGAVLASSFVTLLAARGPLPGIRFDEPFRFRPEALHFYYEKAPRPSTVPAHYAYVAATEEPGRIVEYPWHTTWRYSTFVTEPWSLHRRPVIVCPGERLMWDDRLGFRNMIPPFPDDVLASGAGLFILHLDPLTEELLYERRPPDRVPPGSALARDLELQSADLERFGQQTRMRAKAFIGRWGQPDYSDDLAMVWNLHRVRQERASHP